MFLTLTPNPCFEGALQLPVLTPGTTQRIDSAAVSRVLGGKGINSARVAARFGAKVLALAPFGGDEAEIARKMAAREGFDADFTATQNRTRLCLNMVHEGGICTEIIENGAPLNVEDGTHLLEKWRHYLPQARLAAIGGAYPPSNAPAFEAHAAILCEMAAQAGVKVIYDGRGAAFSRALSSKTPPWAIKPNLAEAAQILGRAIETRADERHAVRDLRGRGAEIVLLSCGARGLYLGHQSGIEWLEAPRVETVSAVGCGDALVGAFAAKWLAGDGIIEAARWGVAAASASAAQVLSAHVSPDEAAILLEQVRVENCEISLKSG